MKNASLSVLNGLLLKEISAMKTYKNARLKLKAADIACELQELHDAHAARATVLQERIASLGGCTATVGGAWGILNRADVAIGEQSAICIFDEGETRTLESYESAIDQLDEQSRDIVAQQLIPEQEATVSVVSAWREAMAEFGERIELAG
ncbi:MAG: DUF2383 domain-containing protein [Candidatus Obscuribacterales bacterium]|nr:DUF2383 domain-containing protein [Candidatus Obscuribacterales bacterium]